MEPCVLGLVAYWPACATLGAVPNAVVESETDRGMSRAGRTGGGILSDVCGLRASTGGSCGSGFVKDED